MDQKKKKWRMVMKGKCVSGNNREFERDGLQVTFSQNKVECKWRYLVGQYNDIRKNKKRTGGKRKVSNIMKRWTKYWQRDTT